LESPAGGFESHQISPWAKRMNACEIVITPFFHIFPLILSHTISKDDRNILNQQTK
jgi:hypothetical protein